MKYHRKKGSKKQAKKTPAKKKVQQGGVSELSRMSFPWQRW